MDRVYRCFDLTDSKVISATLSVRKSESPQDFCRFGAYFEVRTVSLYVVPELTVCFSFEEFSRNFKFSKLRRISFGNSRPFKIRQGGRRLSRLSVHITVDIRLNSASNYSRSRK